MIFSDFEYRLYSGSVAGVPVDLALATALNEFIGGLRLATGRPIRDQLTDFFADQNLTWSFFGNEFDLRPTVDDAIANVDAALTLDPIELFLGQGRWPLVGPVYARLRFYFVSGFELRLPEEKTFANWPDLPALLDPDADQLRIQLNVEQISLLDAGLRVHIYNPFKNEWPELFTVPLLSGTGLYDVATRLALGLSVEPDAYVIGAGSGQRFRPVVPTILQRDSTIDRAEFRFGQVDEWVILALGFLFGLVGALTAVFLSQLQVALGERVLQKIEDDIEAKLAEIDIPTIFDFPSVAKYGAAFERPATEQVTFEYRPGIDVVGGPQNQRAIHFRHEEPEDPPDGGGFDPRDLFDPDSFTNPFDRIHDYVDVGDLIVDLFDVYVPIPDYTTAIVPRQEVDAAVGQLATPRFRLRDRALLHLLADGLPAPLLSGLRWSQVDVRRQVVEIGPQERTRSLKISAESATALRLWREGQARYLALPALRNSPTRVFPTPQGLPLGDRGIVAVLLAYDRWKDILDGWEDPWAERYRTAPPLPDTLDTLVALGYAVNFVVPNVQYAFLHAADGFALASPELATTDYTGVYPLPPDQEFVIRALTPPDPPPVEFFDPTDRPRLRLATLPLELELAGAAQAPLRATARVHADLAIRFHRCPSCVAGKEDLFQGLLRNLLCLQDVGLIELQGNPAELLQCLIHRHAIALIPSAEEGAVTVESVAIDDPGGFPPGSAAELAALLTATLPLVLSRAIPVPVLFDFFHRIPLGSRNREAETLAAKSGWLTLVQPLV